MSNLWSLAKHWEHCANDAQTDEIRQTYLRTAKQLRQRIKWVEESIEEQKTQERRSDNVAILESFVRAGWIQRYNMVDDKVTFWETEAGIKGALAFLEALQSAPQTEQNVKIKSLTEISQWLADVRTKQILSGDTTAD